MSKLKIVAAPLPVMGAVAAIMSWTVNKSIGWSVVHFFCGLFYVLYAACAHNEELTEALKAAGL